CDVSGVLSVEGITRHFYGVAALSDVSFEVQPGELLSIIGPNGSGKTTLFNIITGFLRADRGRVHLHGKDITGQPPHAIARKGLVRTFQDVRLFANLSALDNLRLAIQQHQEENLFARFLWTPRVRRLESEATRRASALLEEFGLAAFGHTPAARLSYGQRKL